MLAVSWLSVDISDVPDWLDDFGYGLGEWMGRKPIYCREATTDEELARAFDALERDYRAGRDVLAACED